MLADPERFESATLSDPVEGPEYGRSVAKILRQADGTPWIHSFAHGRTIYKLKLDARAAKAALAQARDEAVADEFVRLALAGHLDDAEVEDLLNLAHQRTGTGKRPLASKLKAARNEQNRRNAEQQQQRRLSERRDPRPRIPVPLPDSEWLPCMKTLNEVIGACRAAEPPVRNTNRRVALARGRDIPSLHVLTSGETNDDDGPTNPTANTGAAGPPPAQ